MQEVWAQVLTYERCDPGTFPIHSPRAGTEFKEFSRSAHDFAHLQYED